MMTTDEEECGKLTIWVRYHRAGNFHGVLIFAIFVVDIPVIVIIVQLMASSALLQYYFSEIERSKVQSPEPARLQLQIARLCHIMFIIDACAALCTCKQS